MRSRRGRNRSLQGVDPSSPREADASRAQMVSVRLSTVRFDTPEEIQFAWKYVIEVQDPGKPADTTGYR